MRVEGVSKIPSKGVEQKREEGKQRFKKRGELGQGVGALKEGGWKPLTNYALSFHTVFQVFKVLN